MMVTAHNAQAATPVAQPHSGAAGGDAPRQQALREANPQAQNPRPDQSVPPASAETRLQEAQLRERQAQARREGERRELDSYREVAREDEQRAPLERRA